jgi:hypothetical protein
MPRHSFPTRRSSDLPEVVPPQRHRSGTTGSASGWGVACELSGQSGIVTALAWADDFDLLRDPDALNSFIISTLDSLVVNQETRYNPGPITAFTWPKTTAVPQGIRIGARDIVVPLDAEDAEAAQNVVERLYATLLYYQSAPALYQAAWQWYYAQIFRDSVGRLRPAAETILDALATDEEGTLRNLLVWVQDQPYARGLVRSDFVGLPAIIAGAPSDCDSRALLIAAIMHHRGSKTALFVNEKYGHAWFGIQSPLPGVQKEIKGVRDRYLLCETVARVTPGMVPQDLYADPGWLPIILSW